MVIAAQLVACVACALCAPDRMRCGACTKLTHGAAAVGAFEQTDILYLNQNAPPRDDGCVPVAQPINCLLVFTMLKAHPAWTL